MFTDELYANILIVALEYCGVFLAILADLWSGWRKAVALGEKRTSKALRKTVDKTAKYFNALIALTILDGMVMMAAEYLQELHGWAITAFPLFSMTGAMGLAVIEIKSIGENIGKKKEMQKASALAGSLLSNPDVTEAAKKLIDFLKREDSGQ